MEHPVCCECHDEISEEMAFISGEGDICCDECVEKMPAAKRRDYHKVNIRRLRQRWGGMLG